MLRKKKKLTLILLIVIFSVLIILTYVVCFTSFDKTLSGDWGYFNSLRLIIKSTILHYHKLPFHDPWIIGGYDYFANPESQIISPFMFLVLIFNPHEAGIIYFLILGVIGSVSAYYLFRYLNISKSLSVLGGFLFINSSWMSLHFVEGHVIFAPFQLFPLLLLFSFRITEARVQLYLVLLLSFFFLEGAMYPAFFAPYVVLAALLCKPGKVRALISRMKRKPLWFILLILTFVLLASPKIVPTMFIFGSRYYDLHYFQMPFADYWNVFLNPMQTYFTKPPSNTDLLFHEVGCYLGILSVLIIINSLFSKHYRNNNMKYILVMLLFLWMGTGLGRSFNPWIIHHMIPFVKHAHVQSRIFIIMYLFFVILLMKSLMLIRKRKFIFMLLFCFLFIESFAVRTNILKNSYERNSDTADTNDLITSDNIETTVSHGDRPMLYYDKNIGHIATYESAALTTYVKHNKDPEYKGEVYFEKGKGLVRLLSYIPGSIKVSYKKESNDAVITVNTNYLAGWKVINGAATIKKNSRNLLSFIPLSREGVVELEYFPRYLYIIIPAFIVGIFLFIFMYRRCWG